MIAEKPVVALDRAEWPIESVISDVVNMAGEVTRSGKNQPTSVADTLSLACTLDFSAAFASPEVSSATSAVVRPFPAVPPRPIGLT